VHWPRHEKLNRKFAAESERGKITGHYSRITVPGKYEVFTLSDPGTEYLCVLNSGVPIMNLPERLKQINTMKGDLSARIQKAFNAKSAGSYHDSFENERIVFYGSGGKNAVVSILMEFDVGR